MWLYFPLPLYFLSLIPAISLSPGFCPGRCLPSLLLQFVSGKWGSPSPQLHPSRTTGSSWSPIVVPSILASYPLGQKLRAFYGTAENVGPEKPVPVERFPWAMLWALHSAFSFYSPFFCPLFALGLSSAQVQISVCSGQLLSLDRALREELDKYSNIALGYPLLKVQTVCLEQQNRALTGGDTFLSHLRICQLIGLATQRQFS